jgi:ketosteroid isomerase-like protein
VVKAKRKSARRSARKSRSKAKSKAKPKSVTVAALKRAVEGRHAEALAAMYADNAVMLLIDHDNPPSNPRRLAGKAAISSYFCDVCGRDMAHLIENAIAAGNRLAFTQSCTYADGTKVFCEKSRSTPSFRPGTASPRPPPNCVRHQSFTWNLPGTEACARNKAVVTSIIRRIPRNLLFNL